MTSNAMELGPTGSAELVLSFVNTRPNGNGQPELLDDRAGFASWLKQHGLVKTGAGVTDADAAGARELRESLASLLRAHVGIEAPRDVADAEAHLLRTAERYPVVPRISADGTTLVPSQSGVPGAFGAIVAAVAETSARGLWPRLKMCRNAPCHASFLDRTKNTGGLYCSATCSSQMSMRAYRSRLKAAAT